MEEAPADPADALAPTAERRLVSVVFVDLVGFTTLSESRDAEAVRDVLTRYFDTCKRVIALYGGTVEKFIGDAVMAVWGTPVAQEDDAERAVRAALEMVSAVTALGAAVGASDLQARAGVLTGEAAVTLGARTQGWSPAIWSTRHPGSSPPLSQDGSWSADPRAAPRRRRSPTRRPGRTSSRDGRSPSPSIAPSGHRRPGQSAQGHRLRRPLHRARASSGSIKELFHASAEEHRAQLVWLSGPAGVGKSRLVWEFETYVDGLVDDVMRHRGRCLAYGEGVVYWPLAEMVRMRCGIHEDDDAASAREKLGVALQDHLEDASERQWVEARLAHLLGLESAGARRERRRHVHAPRRGTMGRAGRAARG